ncbi:MAG: alpha/beta hydrolase, partial [Acetobacteraceae bacterium]
MADSRLDADMAAFRAAQDKEATQYPPIGLEIPLDPHRAVNEALSMPLARGGPAMAESADRWV